MSNMIRSIEQDPVDSTIKNGFVNKDLEDMLLDTEPSTSKSSISYSDNKNDSVDIFVTEKRKKNRISSKKNKKIKKSPEKKTNINDVNIFGSKSCSSDSSIDTKAATTKLDSNTETEISDDDLPVCFSQDLFNIDHLVISSKCPLCLKVYDKIVPHVKKCAFKRKLSVKQLFEILKLQKKHDKERQQVGLPIVPEKVESRRKRRPKVSPTGLGSSLELALALSKSESEEKERALIEEADSLVEAGLPDEAAERLRTLEQFGFSSSSSSGNPGVKLDDPKKRSLLLTRTPEEREKILTEKVAMVLLEEENNEMKADEKEFSANSSPKSSKLKRLHDKEPETDEKPGSSSTIETTALRKNTVIKELFKFQVKILNIKNEKFNIAFINSWKRIFRTKEFSDVTIITEDGCKIAVHKFILLVRCPIILKSVTPNENINDINTPYVIKWNAISKIAANIFLKYIYCGEFQDIFNQSTKIMEELSILIKRYKVKELEKYINEVKFDDFIEEYKKSEDAFMKYASEINKKNCKYKFNGVENVTEEKINNSLSINGNLFLKNKNNVSMSHSLSAKENESLLTDEDFSTSSKDCNKGILDSSSVSLTNDDNNNDKIIQSDGNNCMNDDNHFNASPNSDKDRRSLDSMNDLNLVESNNKTDSVSVGRGFSNVINSFSAIYSPYSEDGCNYDSDNSTISATSQEMFNLSQHFNIVKLSPEIKIIDHNDKDNDDDDDDDDCSIVSIKSVKTVSSKLPGFSVLSPEKQCNSIKNKSTSSGIYGPTPIAILKEFYDSSSEGEVMIVDSPGKSFDDDKSPGKLNCSSRKTNRRKQDSLNKAPQPSTSTSSDPIECIIDSDSDHNGDRSNSDDINKNSFSKMDLSSQNSKFNFKVKSRMIEEYKAGENLRNSINDDSNDDCLILSESKASPEILNCRISVITSENHSNKRKISSSPSETTCDNSVDSPKECKTECEDINIENNLTGFLGFNSHSYADPLNFHNSIQNASLLGGKHSNTYSSEINDSCYNNDNKKYSFNNDQILRTEYTNTSFTSTSSNADDSLLKNNPFITWDKSAKTAGSGSKYRLSVSLGELLDKDLNVKIKNECDNFNGLFDELNNISSKEKKDLKIEYVSIRNPFDDLHNSMSSQRVVEQQNVSVATTSFVNEHHFSRHNFGGSFSNNPDYNNVSFSENNSLKPLANTSNETYFDLDYGTNNNHNRITSFDSPYSYKTDKMYNQNVTINDNSYNSYAIDNTAGPSYQTKTFDYYLNKLPRPSTAVNDCNDKHQDYHQSPRPYEKYEPWGGNLRYPVYENNKIIDNNPTEVAAGPSRHNENNFLPVIINDGNIPLDNNVGINSNDRSKSPEPELPQQTCIVAETDGVPPDFDLMDDNEIMKRLEKYGLKKQLNKNGKARALLKFIYDELHPSLPEDIVTDRKSLKKIAQSFCDTSNLNETVTDRHEPILNLDDCDNMLIENENGMEAIAPMDVENENRNGSFDNTAPMNAENENRNGSFDNNSPMNVENENRNGGFNDSDDDDRSSEESDIIEEVEEDESDADEVDANYDKAYLGDVLQDYIRSNRELFASILSYKVIQLNNIIKGLHALGIKFKVKDLMEELDKEGIVYQGRYNLRKRKPNQLEREVEPKVARKVDPNGVIKKATTKATQNGAFKKPLAVKDPAAVKGRKKVAATATATVTSSQVNGENAGDDPQIYMPNGEDAFVEATRVCNSVTPFKIRNGQIEKNNVDKNAHAEQNDAEWVCEICTLINKPTALVCGVCETQRPGEEDKFSYEELVELENHPAVLNREPFDCKICLERCEPGDGVVLRDCLHSFCRDCLAGTIQNADDVVKCPYRDEAYVCTSKLQEREINFIAPPEVVEKHHFKVLKLAENTIANTFHCKTPDCKNWCIIDDDGAPENVNVFPCSACGSVNCIPCQAIHPRMNCLEYQRHLEIQSMTDPKAKKTLQYIQQMLTDKKAMHCPKCNVIVMKSEGCDWIKCSMCRTEICWATLGPRWGPLGFGDTSGGCKCNLKMGKPCHPSCRNCH